MKSKSGQDRARQRGAVTPTISKTLTVETGNRDNPDLKDSESRYRRLFESARHGILILDARTGTIEDVNPYLLGMLGYSRPELLGKRFWEVAAFKDVEADQGDFEALQANECIRRENLPLRAKGGHLIEVELVSCVYEENGRRVMQCEIRDIAGRVQNDGSLPPAEAELRALFASMRDVVLVIDRRGDYREIAPTHPGLLFKPPHELLGRNLRDTFSAELAQAFLGTIRQVLETGQTAQIEYELPIGGRLVWFAASVSRMDNDRTLWVARDVTESRQGEEALRAAHANYQSLFNNSTVGIYRSTPQGGFLDVNPAMARIFAYASAEEMIRSVTSIEKQSYVDPDARRNFQRLIMEHGEVREFTSQARRADGQTIWVRENARAVTAADGSVLYYEGFMTDITERKQAEEALQQSEARYRAVTESASDAIISADSAGRITGWNHGAQILFGYSADEAVGHLLTLLMRSGLAKRQLAGLARLRAAGKQKGLGKALELEGRHKDGRQVPVEFTLSDWTLAGGRFYTAIVRDITGRKRAEAERGKLAAIVDSSEHAIIGSTLEGVITSWNSGAQRLYGHSADEAIGRPLSMLAPPDRQGEPLEILALLKQGESVKQLETVRVTKGGVRLDVSISISPVRDAAGRVVSIASIAHDITERKRAQDELRRAKDKLEATNSELQLSLAREEALARTDGLTGLYNRSYFKELAAREFSAAARYQRALSILMIDVDNFKSINDTLGHAAGDQVLALIAQNAGRHIRAADVLARFGGDEFILLLPETNSRQALTVADRIRAGIAATPVQAGMASLAITLSIGIAGLRPGPAVDSVEELIQRADQALYRAKAEGRNRIVALEEGGT